MTQVGLDEALASHCKSQGSRTTGVLHRLGVEWDEEGIWNQEGAWTQVLALLLSDCVGQAHDFLEL